jgi:broad specificity phosphatase PhoE
MNKWALLLCASLPGLALAGGLDIYLVRHGETMGNVTGNYTEENQRRFSERGLKQIDALTERLQGYRFDEIIVSPLWRTQKTILPYLQQTGATAEIWPELMESDCGLSGDEQPAADITLGEEIERIDEEKFRYRDGNSTRLYACATRKESLAQIQRGVSLLLERYRGTGKTILVVGHGCTGSRYAELLLGLKPRGRFTPNNTAFFHIRIDDAGKPELLLLNDRQPNFIDRFFLSDGDGPAMPGCLNLAGTWKIRAGDDLQWKRPEFDDADWAATRVPGGWEADALPGYDGMAWYRRDFAIDDQQRNAWTSNQLVLLMGGIDDADETFLNGERIGGAGDMEAGGKSAYRDVREYAVAPGQLHPHNVLAVRVSDWGGGGGIWCPPVVLGPAEALPAR